MLRITCDPSVLDELQRQFPEPPKSAKRQLEKYLKVLETDLLRSMIGRSRFAQLRNLYEFPLHRLWNGPKIGSIKNGSKQLRVHEWLNKNNLALIKNVNPNANNLTGEISKLKPTHLLTITETETLAWLRQQSDADLDIYLDSLTDEWREKVEREQDKYLQANSQFKADNYDTTYIDVQSLKDYLKKLIKKQFVLNFVQEGTAFHQARFILRIAQVNNGQIHQLRSPKAFGRTYYEGHYTVQSVKKQLRAAMLGTSWEYDCKSCSTAWKMAFSTEYFNQKKRPRGTVREKFSAMTMYLERKEHFFNIVMSSVFTNTSHHTHAEMNDIIKQAMTALGFGAKLGLGKWKGMFGEERQTSLYEVFDGNRDELERFVNCSIVKKFNKEQQTLNTYIVSRFSGDMKWHADMEKEQKRKKLKEPFKTPQKIVWLFQHAETIMMDLVRDELKKLNITVLANVHDAIVTRQRLAASQLANIEQIVRSETMVEYFALGETKY